MKHLIFVLAFLAGPALLLAQETEEFQYMDAYVVIADTSLDYFALRAEMFDLAGKCKIGIDTLGRRYDPTKDLICLPEDDEDEINAGEYFPRRYPSTVLSLEYLEFYDESKKGDDKTIALVAAIEENWQAAEKLLEAIRDHMKSAYILKSRIHMGCMH